MLSEPRPPGCWATTRAITARPGTILMSGPTSTRNARRSTANGATMGEKSDSGSLRVRLASVGEPEPHTPEDNAPRGSAAAGVILASLSGGGNRASTSPNASRGPAAPRCPLRKRSLTFAPARPRHHGFRRHHPDVRGGI